MERKDVANFCSQFMKAANEQSQGTLFKNWPHYNSNADFAITRLKQMFTEHFGILFPSVEAENAIAREAILKSGIQIENLNAFKKEGLKPLATILGRVQRLG